MAKIKSDYFLLNGNSFFTETEGGTATVVRSGVGKKLTQTEKDVAGDHYNSTKDTIDFAQIYDLDFGPHYISKLGASDTWMSQTRLKEYKNAFKKATGESGPNISFAQAVEAGKLWNPTPLNENANGKSTSTTDFNGSVLRYPLLNTGRYDYLSIASYKNEPDRFDTNTSFTSMRTVEERMTGSALGRVFLPMQPGIAEQTQVQWSQDTMNALEAAGANISGGTIKGAASGTKEAAQAFMRNTSGAAKGLAGKAASKVGGFAVKIFGKAAKFIAPAMKSAKPFVSKFFGKIPIIGPIVVGLVSVISGEPLGKALFKTIGAALGGALGTFIPIPVLGTLIGETIGVFVGDLLYEGLMGKGWGAAGKKLLSSLMKIFSAGKAVVKWIGSGFKRFWKKIPKIKIPDIPKNPPKWIPNWVPFKNKVWNVFKTGVKVLIGPLSLLMGQEVPNLLWLMNPIKTLPAAIKSFFPPKGEGGGDADKIKTKEMEDADDEKKKKKKKKVNPLAKKVEKLEKELKIAKKKKMLIFKVNRVDAGGDIAEQTSYEQTGTTIITQPIVEETIVHRNSGGGGTSLVINTTGETTNMEAALS